MFVKQSGTVPTAACFVKTGHKFEVFQNEFLKEVLIFGGKVLSYLGSLWEKGVLRRALGNSWSINLILILLAWRIW
jgi:hypothetical protein